MAEAEFWAQGGRKAVAQRRRAKAAQRALRGEKYIARMLSGGEGLWDCGGGSALWRVRGFACAGAQVRGLASWRGGTGRKAYTCGCMNCGIGARQKRAVFDGCENVHLRKHIFAFYST